MKQLFIAMMLILATFLAACSSARVEPASPPTRVADSPTLPAATRVNTQPASPTAVPVSSVPQPESGQVANPASVNCINKDGKLEIRKDASGGEFGMCIFPNGQECEEWAFMRGQCSSDADTGKGEQENLVYTNSAYGFSLRYPATWIVEENRATNDQPMLIKLTRDNSILTVQVKRFSEDLTFGAVPPQGGEISEQGNLTVMGQKTPLQVVRLQGKVKSLGASLAVQDLRFRFQLDNSADPEIPEDIILEAQQIIESLQIVK